MKLKNFDFTQSVLGILKRRPERTILTHKVHKLDKLNSSMFCLELFVKIWTKNDIFCLKLRFTDIWSNKGRTVSISQKLVVVPKIPQSQDCKTTFKIVLAFIFLSVRVDLLCTLSLRGPCMYGHTQGDTP